MRGKGERRVKEGGWKEWRKEEEEGDGGQRKPETKGLKLE